MANISIKDSSGKNAYLKASGTGTNNDPFITEQNVSLTNINLPLPTNASTETTSNSIKSLTETSLGQKGHTFVTSTSPQAGQWVALQIVEPTYFTSLTCAYTSSPAINVGLPAGFILYGSISAFTMSYGKVIAYKA